MTFTNKRIQEEQEVWVWEVILSLENSGKRYQMSSESLSKLKSTGPRSELLNEKRRMEPSDAYFNHPPDGSSACQLGEPLVLTNITNNTGTGSSSQVGTDDVRREVYYY